MTKWRGRKKVEEEPYVPCDYDASQFTEEEAYKLKEWQEQFNAEEASRIQNDPRALRMEFTRWLIGHEALNEFGVYEPE